MWTWVGIHDLICFSHGGICQNLYMWVMGRWYSLCWFSGSDMHLSSNTLGASQAQFHGHTKHAESQMSGLPLFGFIYSSLANKKYLYLFFSKQVRLTNYYSILSLLVIYYTPSISAHQLIVHSIIKYECIAETEKYKKRVRILSGIYIKFSNSAFPDWGRSQLGLRRNPNTITRSGHVNCLAGAECRTL